MSCIERSFRNILAAVLIALVAVAAAAPAAVAAPRWSDDRPATAEDGGWAFLLGPWRALEQWLGTISGADEGGDSGGSGGGGAAPPPPPTCPSQSNPGPCTDPGG